MIYCKTQFYKPKLELGMKWDINQLNLDGSDLQLPPISNNLS